MNFFVAGSLYWKNGISTFSLSRPTHGLPYVCTDNSGSGIDAERLYQSTKHHASLYQVQLYTKDDPEPMVLKLERFGNDRDLIDPARTRLTLAQRQEIEEEMSIILANLPVASENQQIDRPAEAEAGRDHNGTPYDRPSRWEHSHHAV